MICDDIDIWHVFSIYQISILMMVPLPIAAGFFVRDRLSDTEAPGAFPTILVEFLLLFGGRTLTK